MDDNTLDQSVSAQVAAKVQSQAELTITAGGALGDFQGKLEGLSFEFLSKVGEGAYGVVWRAKDGAGQEVAVKLVKSLGVGHDWGSFKTELQRLRAVSEHPNIVTLLDANLEGETPYISTLFHEGGSLAQVNEPEIGQTVLWLKQIAEALQFTHARGLLHCDLKPANVLIDKENRVRVADFGQSRLRGDGEVSWGTLGFMAPEQSVTQNAMPEVAWDVYAFGALAYHLLTGTKAYIDEQVQNSLASLSGVTDRLKTYRNAILEGKLTPIRSLNPKVDKPLADLVESCLSPRASDRPTGFPEILEDLQRRETSEPLLCRRPWPKAYRLGRMLRRILKTYRDQFVVVAGVLGLAVSLLGLLLCYSAYGEMKESRRNMARLTCMVIAETSDGIIMLSDGEELSRLNKALERLIFARSCSITDAYGDTLLAWKAKSETGSSKLFEIELPVTRDEEEVGHIKFTGDYDGFWESKGKNVLKVCVLIWLSLALLPWLAAKFVFSRWPY